MTETIILLKGSHSNREAGLCLLEAVAFVAGLPHTDTPECTDPVLGAYGRAVNDWMTDDERQLLVPLIPRLVGTKGDDALSLRRAMLLTDACIRQILPIAMECAGLPEEAEKLKALEPVTSESAARSAASAASAARSARSAAAWSAAWSARSAASAARSARSAAAWSAAWSARSAAAAAAAARSAAQSAAQSARSAARRSEVVAAVIACFTAAIEVVS